MDKLFKWALIVSLGGFLFGFDTAVISGAEQEIQRVWNLSDAVLGQMVAMALYGTILGAVFGGIPTDKYGRKNTLFIIALLYLISALGSALAPDVYSLMFFRFIGGVGVGASSIAAPLYISEIAPAAKRGRLVAMFQFNIVFGILIAFLSNAVVASMAFSSWRIMLGVEVIPAIVFCITILLVPKSPRWLAIKKNDVAEAKRILTLIDASTADHALEQMQQTIAKETAMPKRSVFNKAFRFPVILAILLAIFNQLSGINAILYYAPRIFSMTGMGSSTALLSSAGIGFVNLVFTLLGMVLIDKFGRKTLMYIGSLGYIFSLLFVAYCFQNNVNGTSVMIGLFVFIAAHAIGQGTVIWVYISEIFPNSVRANGQAVGSSTHWILAAIVAGVFPFFAGKFGVQYTFLFFAGMMVLQLLYVWKMMPETKGKALEDIEQSMTN